MKIFWKISQRQCNEMQRPCVYTEKILIANLLNLMTMNMKRLSCRCLSVAWLYLDAVRVLWIKDIPRIIPMLTRRLRQLRLNAITVMDGLRKSSIQTIYMKRLQSSPESKSTVKIILRWFFVCLSDGVNSLDVYLLVHNGQIKVFDDEVRMIVCS